MRTAADCAALADPARNYLFNREWSEPESVLHEAKLLSGNIGGKPPPVNDEGRRLPATAPSSKLRRTTILDYTRYVERLKRFSRGPVQHD